MSTWGHCEIADKVSFGSERSAKQAARNLKNANRAGFDQDNLHAYRCGGHWHIGHDYRGKKKTFRKRSKMKGRRQRVA